MTSPTAADLSIPEAADFLDPQLSIQQWRLLIRFAGVQPVGLRRTGRAGRPYPTYPAAALIRLHGAVAPVLVRLASEGMAAPPPGLLHLCAAASGTDAP